jgi:hypothetical protein
MRTDIYPTVASLLATALLADTALRGINSCFAQIFLLVL